jgi:hypothetical protein
MEKYAPDRFGERKKVEITTRDAEFARLDALTDEQRLAEARDLIESARRRLAMAQWTGQLGDGLGDGRVTDVPEDPESAPK